MRIVPLVRLSEMSALLPLRGGCRGPPRIAARPTRVGPVAVGEDQVASHDQEATTDQEDQHDHRNPVWRDQLAPFLLRGVARGSGHLMVIGGRVAGCGAGHQGRVPFAVTRPPPVFRFGGCHRSQSIGGQMSEGKDKSSNLPGLGRVFGAGQQRIRKFRTRSWPWSVRMPSGWNCTPSTSSSRWRTPMTTPSTLRAVTASTSGMVAGSSVREW